jgi:hypothetical protein
VDVLSEWLSNKTRYHYSYLLITRSQKIYIDEVGEMPTGSLDRVQDALLASGKFDVVFSNEDAIIFALKEGQ